jgi:hypothetical protein
MTSSGERSQSEILGERFRRVPWRRMMREAVRERLGHGPMVLPGRLEGAVFGQLAGSLPWSSRPCAARRSSMLDMLEVLLADRPDPGADASVVAPVGLSGLCAEPPVTVLPIPLVLRHRDDGVLIDQVRRAADAGSVDGERLLASALHALLLRELMTGDRHPSSILRQAAGRLRSVLAVSGLPGSGQLAQPAVAVAALDAFVHRARDGSPDVVVDGFWSGWDAFAHSRSYEEAVTRARSATEAGRSAVGPAVAGGLAGMRWGRAAIPVAWRRAMPDGPRARVLVDRRIETDLASWDGEPWRTSSSSPLQVDALDLTGLDGCAGSVGITSLPGRRYVGYHTGAHWRDLDADAARMRELGVAVLLLLVEDAELVRCRAIGIGEALDAQRVELVRFPIHDPLLPRAGPAFHSTIATLLRRVWRGDSVAIACRGGLDRAGMSGACLLREAGLPPDVAIERVQRARRGALTLPDQQAYVRAWPPGR